MTIDATALFDEQALRPPAGDSSRFGRRWRLVGAGLSNIWLYGDLELPAPSGRLLLRGPNGTGKTTALEALWPFLLDLNASRLAAGKARPTTLRLLMSTGATGKRRYGYAWISLAAPETEEVHSYGVRLQYSEGSSPPVKVIPFTVPGRPLHELALYGASRSPLMLEQFTEAVEAAGGHLFDGDIAYVTELGARLWQCSPAEVNLLAARLRDVRNPTLLGEVSPTAAATALRASLPGVSDDVISATAEALEGSAATREAFARDRDDAEALSEFASLWAGHVTEVTNAAHAEAVQAASEQQRLRGELSRLQDQRDKASVRREALAGQQEALKAEQQELAGHIEGLKNTESYKQAGVLAQLGETLVAQEAAAATEVTALTEAASGFAATTVDVAGSLSGLEMDLEDLDALTAEIDPGRQSVTSCLEHETRPAPVMTVGDTVIDPGPTLVIHGSAPQLVEVAATWTASAERLAQRAQAAQLMISQHKPVAAALEAANKADRAAEAAVGQAERSAAHAVQDAGRAQDASAELADQIVGWSRRDDVASLQRSIDDAGELGEQLVSAEDIEQIRDAEPAQVLGAAEEWAATASSITSQAAAQLAAQATHERAQEQELREQAEAHRQDAAELRSGKLLPLPRPQWVDEADDTTALGSAIDWQKAVSGDHRDRIELALAAAGVLSATLDDTGAQTARWRLTPHRPESARNLSSVLTVDPDHRYAAAAAQVLRRIALADTATGEQDGETLVIGWDGTFAIGVAIGTPSGARPGESAPTASHIGAAQRRAAALREAVEHEKLADGLETQADGRKAAVEKLAARSAAVRAISSRFPSREALRTAESNRATSARAAANDRVAADELGRLALHAHEKHRALASQWMRDTLALDLPADLTQLNDIAHTGRQQAQELKRAATRLQQRTAPALEYILSRAEQLAARRERLPGQLHRARAAHALATKTASKLATLEADSGEDAAATLRELSDAQARHDEIDELLVTGQAAIQTAGEEAARLDGQVDITDKALGQAQPKAEQALAALRRLIGTPGVADVLLGGQPVVEDDLLAQVEKALIGRKTTAKRTLLAGYDGIRARLAGTWALDNANPLDELQTYTLTHRDAVYTPPQAARRAEHLAQQAQQALAAAEEQALRDFIIGRLPAAISTAWTHLHTWINEVNKKMRSATASSGVGVQVRISLSGDMSPASRRVYELCCKTALALRSDADNAELGAALQSLIHAADGESMTDRIAAAVDVRDWIDVHYEVTRPGAEKPERWGQRTGLSGGERRLVVLAPMLAAVAAAYDRSPDTALRLAALDEVPAEVDEQGREGLARYLAALDLDLVCTSYLWDGAPGAWDGIDAHDLEAGPDGTVVAFPMLVRGDELLPDDERQA